MTNDKRLKIFVSAYACEPGLGSEIGVGWHWVLEMSRYFELWVLTRESNRHTIEPWVEEHPEYRCIHFLYFDLPRWARFWKKGLRGVRTYYNLWQTLTNGIVRRTMRDNDIHVFHHLTYGNVLWKVSSYGQRQFFIWGPVGGLETIPEEYSRSYDGKSRLIERVRRLAAALAPYNIGLRRRCRHADLILCKTEITRQALPGAARVAKEGKDVHLTIVGGGKGLLRLQNKIKELQIEQLVTLTEGVEMEAYQRLMQRADVVVNPALKEGAVTVSFDSMAMGKPLICLDTTGYTRYFQGDHAVLIPRTHRQEVVERMAEAMAHLTDREERLALGRKAQAAAQGISWQRHGEEIRDAIIQAYNNQK